MLFLTPPADNETKCKSLFCLVQVVMLNEAYSRVEYRLDREGFDSVPALVRYYVGNRKPVSQVTFRIVSLSHFLAVFIFYFL